MTRTALALALLAPLLAACNQSPAATSPPAPATAPIAAKAEPAALHVADLIADWNRYLGERVTLRGRVYAADDRGAQFKSGNVTFLLRRVDSETLRTLMRDCAVIGDMGACNMTISAVPERPAQFDAFRVLANPLIER